MGFLAASGTLVHSALALSRRLLISDLRWEKLIYRGREPPLRGRAEMLMKEP